MNTVVFNGERLKNARVFRGMSLADLSVKTGLSKQALSQYENAIIKPDASKLFVLSDALHFPIDYFTAESAFDMKPSTSFFRALLSTSKINRAAQNKKLEFVAQIYETLFEYVDFPSKNLPKIKFSGDKSEIEQIAQKTREFWNLGNEPIKELKYTLDSNGIVVLQLDPQAETIDAFSQRININQNEMFFIAIAPNQTFVRARFDMAHELGHILLHQWVEDVETLSREEFKEIEDEANRFASAFLLPEETFGRDVRFRPNNLDYYIHLKSKWNVSIQAMVFRAHTLGIISTTQYQYLWRRISSKGWRTREPDDKPFDKRSNLLQSAVELLFNENELSPTSFLFALKQKGIIMESNDIEDLIGLKRGTLEIKTSPIRLLKIKAHDN